MEKSDIVLKHIRCSKGDIAPYVIIPGDPGRVKRIVDMMDDAKLLAQNREYVVYTGTYKEAPITVCSSGIGGPAASIAFEELIKLISFHLVKVHQILTSGLNEDVEIPVFVHAVLGRYNFSELT